jgi:hypothetical protein
MAPTPTLIARFERQRRWQLSLATLLVFTGSSLLLQERSAFLPNNMPARTASAFAATAQTPPQVAAVGGPANFVPRAFGGGNGGRPGAVTPRGVRSSDGGQSILPPAAVPGTTTDQGLAPSPPVGAPPGTGIGTSTGSSSAGGPGFVSFDTPGPGAGTVPGTSSSSTGGSTGGGSTGGGSTGGGSTGGGSTGGETTPGAVPEPETWAMMIMGMAIAGFVVRRRGKQAKA